MSEQAVRITREELYQKIWTTPFVQLARELGYSYVELVGICAALNLPRPSGGYWYRLRHSGNSEQVPLPPAATGTPDGLTFGPQKLNPPSVPTQLLVEQLDAPRVEGTEPKAASEPQPKVDVGELTTAPAAAPELPEVVAYTREELHKAMWSTPCVKLAAKLGISDVALAKTCRKMGIPRPPRGYWARIEAGERLKKERLPAAKPGQTLEVKFCVADNAARRAEWAVNNILTARRAARPGVVELPPEGSELHPLVEKHRVALEKAKPGELGFVAVRGKGLFSCEMSAALVPRFLQALDAVVGELEDRDFGFEPGEDEYDGLVIKRDEDEATLAWTEAKLEIERAPTDIEKRKPSWTWQLKETKPSGELSVEVNAFGLKGKRKWTEGVGRSLEEVLGVVVEKVEAIFRGFEERRMREAERAKLREEEAKRHAELRAQEAEKQAKEEKERKEQERINQHAAKLVQITKARRENLSVAVELWTEAQEMAEFIDSCEERWRRAGGGQLSKERSDWLMWARAEAAKLGPFAKGYPDPALDGIFDASAIPVGGPYPKVRELSDEGDGKNVKPAAEPQAPSQQMNPWPEYSRWRY